MTEFQQELFKIIVDKVLLGAIAVGFAFFLAKLLENYKNKKAYELFVWQQRVGACREASRIITEHYYSVSEALEGLMDAAEKGDISMEDENGEKLLQHANRYPGMRNELIALGPFLVPTVADAIIQYLDETGKVSDLVKGKFEGGRPTKEGLMSAHSKFTVTCASVIDAGPHGINTIERNGGKS